MPQQDQELLREIRENYSYATEKWRPHRDERNIDMRFINGDPWEPVDRKARQDAKRPCLNHDELTQYVNSTVNNVRQNKRGIKISPDGDGADEKTSDFQQSLTRTMEKRSHGPSIYANTYQQMVEGSYGFFRVSREYIPGSFNQRVTLAPIPNPDAVVFYPDCKTVDWSDAKYSYVLDPLTKRDFEAKYPDRVIRGFTSDLVELAPQWLHGDKIVTAEYWKVIDTKRTLYQLPNGETTYDAEAKKHAIRQRTETIKRVKQYITNGVEILEESDQPGTILPIIPMIGMERWINTDGTSKRVLSSLIRLARDAQMSLAYYVSQEAEEAGLSPKAPVMGYKGQFESDRETWDTLNKIPHAYVQVDVISDGANGVLPLPVRPQFVPNFQAYEIAKESARRSIQAAIGINPLPTAAQRQNQKSGVALERIKEQEDIGSYHFIDSYDRALTLAGRVILDWNKATLDTEREETLRMADGSHRTVRINTEEPYVDEKSGETEHFQVDKGEHYPDISEGPSYQSQREAAEAFLDQLIGNLQVIASIVGAGPTAKLLSLAITLRNIGPLGDEMAEIVSPSDPNNLSPQAQQALQQAKQQSQQLYAYINELQSQIQQLQQEKAARIVDNTYKLQIEKMREENSLAIAEINTKAQSISERLEFVQDMWKQLHGQAHEAALDEANRGHEADMAQQQAVVAAQQQQSAQDSSAPNVSGNQ